MKPTKLGFASSLVLFAVLAMCITSCLRERIKDKVDDALKEDDPDEGQSFAVTISALTGGTIETSSGRTSLTVPAGSLSMDTTITLDVRKSSGDAVTSIYDFTPDGTLFSTPATLSVEYSGDADGNPILASRSSGGDWTPLENNSYSFGVVKGDVSHFTEFTVIIEEDEEEETDDTVEPGDCDWSMVDSCLAEVGLDCWTPEGSCTLSMEGITGSSTIEWANGARLLIDVSTSGGTTYMTAYGTNGSTCWTGTIDVSGTSAVQTITTARGDTVTIQTSATQMVEVTCPDGTTESWTPTEFAPMDNCVSSGEETENCTVEMEGLPGQCDSPADCASGEACCDLGVGIMMCMPTTDGTCPL